MREFYTQVNEFYYAALARALALKKTRDYIAALLKHHAPLKAKAEELGEKLRDINSQADNVKIEADWQRIQSRFTHQHFDAARDEQRYMATIAEFSTAVSRKESEYLDFVIERQTFLNNQVNIVMASARADVGLEGKTTKLDEQTHEMSQRVRDAVERYKEFHQAELRDMNMLEDDD
jgi:vacuolar-type H+-ATPase subunit D/Vma8